MRMGLFVRLATTATLVSVFTAGCQFGGDAFKAEFTRSEELTGPVAGITMLDIRTDVGKIHMDAAGVDEIRVQAEIKVKAATEEMAEELAEGVRIVLEPSRRNDGDQGRQAHWFRPQSVVCGLNHYRTGRPCTEVHHQRR